MQFHAKHSFNLGFWLSLLFSSPILMANAVLLPLLIQLALAFAFTLSLSLSLSLLLRQHSRLFTPDATRDKILVEEQSRAQESLKRRMDKLRQSIQEANQAVALERKKNVDLLYLIFPPLIAQRLWLGQTVEAQTCDEVTVLFSDIVGFTSICSTATPIMVINMLNELYTRFDQFCGEIDVYKVRTLVFAPFYSLNSTHYTHLLKEERGKETFTSYSLVFLLVYLTFFLISPIFHPTSSVQHP